MVHESTKVDLARSDRLRDQKAEKPKAKAQESEFDQLLKRQQVTQQVQPQQSKAVTEQAIRESAKREDREHEDRKKDEGARKEKKETRHGGERHELRPGETKVVAKGSMGERGRGREGGGGKEGGFEGFMGRRGMSARLTRAGVKSVPVDLAGKFALKMAQMSKAAAAQQAQLTPQVLQKIVQHVRIGINQAGEKEIQLDLHGEIFRGLKLRVTSHKGRVGVHFRTGDRAGRALFEKNRDAIRDALAKKGIEVDELTVA